MWYFVFKLRNQTPCTMFKYLNLIAHFRGETFNAMFKLAYNENLKTEKVVSFICETLKTTIPASEISSTITLSDKGTYNAFEGHKCDLTKKKEPETAFAEEEEN